MRRTVLMLSLLAGAGLAGAAAAAPVDREFYTGDTLYQRCSAGPADTDFSARRGACRGYILGVSDTLQTNQTENPVSGPTRAAAVCLPDVDADQVVETVTHYLNDHADQRRYAAADVIFMALKSAYPCPK